MIEDANKDGVKLLAQIIGPADRHQLRLRISLNPFCERPAYKAIAHLPFEERLSHLKDPAFIPKLLAEKTEDPLAATAPQLLGPHLRAQHPRRTTRPPLGESMEARAAAAGVPIEEFVYDLFS